MRERVPMPMEHMFRYMAGKGISAEEISHKLWVDLDHIKERLNDEEKIGGKVFGNRYGPKSGKENPPKKKRGRPKTRRSNESNTVRAKEEVDGKPSRHRKPRSRVARGESDNVPGRSPDRSAVSQS